MVGYSVNGYFLWNCEKLRHGRDIIFDESKMFSKINNVTDHNTIFENLNSIKNLWRWECSYWIKWKSWNRGGNWVHWRNIRRWHSREH